jgi:hypothetical protein
MKSSKAGPFRGLEPTFLTSALWKRVQMVLTKYRIPRKSTYHQIMMSTHNGVTQGTNITGQSGLHIGSYWDTDYTLFFLSVR